MTVKVKQLSKTIDGYAILEDVNFEMLPGSIIGLVGRNGAGKTTLMRLMSGEMQATTGEVILGDNARENVFYLDTLSSWINGYNATTALTIMSHFYPKFDTAQFKAILASQA